MEATATTESAEVDRIDRVLYSIQALRALAAWSVVFHHYCIIFAPAGDPSWWRGGFMAHGSVGVDVFFVVSGLVMGLSAGEPAVTPRMFIAKRIGRIVPIYWLCTGIVALVILYGPNILVNQGYSPELMIKSLLFIPSENPAGGGMLPVITVGWTLNYEMMFYVIVAIALFVKLPQRWLWIVLGVVLLQRVLVPLDVVSSYYSSSLVYEFLLGIVAAHLWRAGAIRGPSWVFGILAVAAVAFILKTPADTPSRGLHLGIPAFVLVCAFLGLERHFKRAPVLKHLGDHSYSVYLIHPTILYTGWYVYHQVGNKALFGRGFVITSILSLIAIAVVAAASYRLIEKPAGRWVTRVLSPRR